MESLTYSSLGETTMNNTTLSAMFVGIMILSLILSLIMIISFWKIFKRCGKPGWAILVPIYNVIVTTGIDRSSLEGFVDVYYTKNNE